MSANRVLVTGATGFVGRALVAELVRRGRTVRAATRGRAVDPVEGAEYVETGDIAGADWGATLAGVDAIVHAAARAHVVHDPAPDPLAAFREVNRDATLALAAQAATHGVRRFVFISSIGVNGGETRDRPFRADDPAAPHSPYAVAKYEAELGLERIAAETGLEIVIVRPPLVIGPAPKGNLGTLVGAIESGLPMPLGAVTSNRRDLVSLPTLVDLLAACLDHPAAGGQTLLVSDGAPISTRQLVERLGEEIHRRPRLIPVPPRLLRTLLHLAGRRGMAAQLLGNLEVDIKATRSLLGWNPPVSTGA